MVSLAYVKRKQGYNRACLYGIVLVASLVSVRLETSWILASQLVIKPHLVKTTPPTPSIMPFLTLYKPYNAFLTYKPIHLSP
ncbi:hypothetical protein DD769_08065 [Helicobacter pylori]|nr:hypothetical protein DD769_08065 [Helicobacter pylori]